MKRKICIVTGTRADYGLLYWLIKAIKEDDELTLQLVVTGMHLSPEFGLTYKQIEEDGFYIDKKIEILLSSDTSIGISKSVGLGTISLAEAFSELKPDLIILLGDRFEIFAAATAAMIGKIPIAHLHGGEATEGLIDEPIRHSVTKMSHLHFTSTEEYRQRVIQLGENPSRVFNVGALGIESINKLQLLDKKTLEENLKFQLGENSVLVTFHPLTLENSSTEQITNLLEVLNENDNLRIIFTKGNADTDGRIINEMIDAYVKNHTNCVAFTSLGQLRYLSVLKHIDFVIGNSSSGLIEVPSFKIPTINIGDRQKGRIKASSVIDCYTDKESLRTAIQKAMDKNFRKQIINVKNPYGDKNASEQILPILKSFDLVDILKKRFYNINQTG